MNNLKHISYQLVFTVLLITGWNTSTEAQNIIFAEIQNAESGKPVAYANIGIIQYQTGTVSDEKGQFELKYRSADDELTISAIGYRQVSVSVQELKNDPVIKLEPIIYDLDEIEVIRKGPGRPKELGYNLKKKGQSIGFGGTQLGTEIAGRVEVDRETIIYSAHFILNHSKADSLLFRVNLYNFSGDTLGENLIRENVIIQVPSEPGTIDINLSAFNIVATDDVLLSLEWIRSYEDVDIQDITFRAKNTRRNANVYFRPTSQAPFMSFEDITKMNIGFYLKVRQVNK